MTIKEFFEENEKCKECPISEPISSLELPKITNGICGASVEDVKNAISKEIYFCEPLASLKDASEEAISEAQNRVVDEGYTFYLLKTPVNAGGRIFYARLSEEAYNELNALNLFKQLQLTGVIFTYDFT